MQCVLFAQGIFADYTLWTSGKREQLDNTYQYAIPSGAFAAMAPHLKITAVEDVTL